MQSSLTFYALGRDSAQEIDTLFRKRYAAVVFMANKSNSRRYTIGCALCVYITRRARNIDFRGRNSLLFAHNYETRAMTIGGIAIGGDRCQLITELGGRPLKFIRDTRILCVLYVNL